MTEEFNQFAQKGFLKERLDALAARRGFNNIAVGICVSGATTFAATTVDDADYSSWSEHSTVLSGCITKAITATLISCAVAEGRVTLQDDVGALLDDERAKGIELRHLLSHTHGVDGSLIERSPYRDDRMIDARALCDAAFRAQSLSKPGEHFNYGSLGPWLAAAVLERLYQLPYAKILLIQLHDKVRYSTDDNANHDPSRAHICPATGGSLRVSGDNLANLLRLHFASAQSAPGDAEHSLALMHETRFKLNCWQPKIREIALGWNGFNEGWFGHGAMMHGDSAIIRFQPSTAVGIVITASREEAASATLSALFAHLLPEFKTVRAPEYLSKEAWLDADTTPYVGTFASASLRVTIDVAANRSLRSRVYKNHDGHASETEEPYVKRYLKPAVGDLFISTPAEPLVIPYINFLSRDASGRYAHLYTGKQLLRRID